MDESGQYLAQYSKGINQCAKSTDNYLITKNKLMIDFT